MIAIIAILAVILFPVFARAREKARANSCLSNVKQLALGVIMYMSDADQTLPPGSNPGFAVGSSHFFPTGTTFYWADGVYPYVKNEQIFLCPSRQGAGTIDYAINFYLYGPLFYHKALGGPHWTDGPPYVPNESQFVDPATKVMLTESWRGQPQLIM